MPPFELLVESTVRSEALRDGFRAKMVGLSGNDENPCQLSRCIGSTQGFLQALRLRACDEADLSLSHWSVKKLARHRLAFAV
jgi:hypothetical protein